MSRVDTAITAIAPVPGTGQSTSTIVSPCTEASGCLPFTEMSAWDTHAMDAPCTRPWSSATAITGLCWWDTAAEAVACPAADR